MSSQNKGIAFKLRNVLADRERIDFRLLIGRILTVIDGTIADATQRKAVKDMIERHLYAYQSTTEGTRDRLMANLAEVLNEKENWLPTKSVKEFAADDNPFVIID